MKNLSNKIIINIIKKFYLDVYKKIHKSYKCNFEHYCMYLLKFLRSNQSYRKFNNNYIKQKKNNKNNTC